MQRGENLTVEQLNIKITADAKEFREEIQSVNEELSKMSALAAAAANQSYLAYRGVFSGGLSGSDTAPIGITATVDGEGNTEKTPMGYYGDNPNIVGIPYLNETETVIGAVQKSTEGGEENLRPIQISTTIELDGDKVGESVSSYNYRRNRVTNGLG